LTSILTGIPDVNAEVSYLLLYSITHNTLCFYIRIVCFIGKKFIYSWEKQGCAWNIKLFTLTGYKQTVGYVL